MNLRQKKALIAYIGGMFFIFGILSAPKALTFDSIVSMILSPISFVIAIISLVYAYRR